MSADAAADLLAQARAAAPTGNMPEVLSLAQQAIAANPAIAEAHSLAAYALLNSGDAPRAIEYARKATELSPKAVGLVVNLARAMMADPAHTLEQVLETLDKAAALNPDWAEPVISASEACIQKGRFRDAIARARPALARFPSDVELLSTLANALHFLGHHEEALEMLSTAIARSPADLRLISSAAHISNYLHTWTPEQVFETHRRYGRALMRHFPPRPVPVTPLPREGRRLRVGIISPDLRQHSVAYFVRPLLEHIDQGRFEVFAYPTKPARDEMSASLQKLAQHWRPLIGGSPDETAAAIRADRLDLLIELAGHTQGHSLPAISRGVGAKVATYLGYPNTTGLSSVNYRIVDSYTDPAGAEAFSTEKLIRIDPCFICFSPHAGAPDPAPPPFLSRGHITFGSFNTLKKVNASTIELWAGALQAVPGSRMLFKSSGMDETDTQGDLRAQFERAGISPSRLEFMGQVRGTHAHLESYCGVDIALDTFPYHGTTTTCEALWMGVPVVSLVGRTHASRVGLSLLSAIGMPHLATPTPQAFADVARSLAADPEQLKRLRTSLRSTMQGSVLCDGRAFARRFEHAIEQMI